MRCDACRKYPHPLAGFMLTIGKTLLTCLIISHQCTMEPW